MGTLALQAFVPEIAETVIGPLVGGWILEKTSMAPMLELVGLVVYFYERKKRRRSGICNERNQRMK
jgi:hypothetical protein